MSRSFFDFFPPPKILAPSVVGLSIADDAVRIVEYRDKHGKLSLKTSAEYPLTKGIVVDGVIVGQVKLVEFLKKIVKEQSVVSCALALPEEKSFVYATKISLEKAPEFLKNLPDDLPDNLSNKAAAISDKKTQASKNVFRGIVEATLAENIPLSAKEAVFDFVLLSVDKKNSTADIVVYAFPLSLANSYLENVSRAGITPICFETESQAVTRAVVSHGHSGTHLVLHFMGYKAIIAIVSDGVVFYASTILHNSGAQEPVELIMVKDGLTKVASYWHSEREVKMRERGKIQSVIVSGKVDQILDLPDYISKNLQIPSHMANVWQNAFSLNETIPETAFGKSLVFASASGSALLPFLDNG